MLAYNRSRSVLDFAMMSGAVDGELTQDNVSACDLVLIALYPEATVDWFRRMAAHIGSHPVVIDCGGTKRTICAACFPIAEEYGVTFLGGHPMAGTQFSGFKNAKADLFHGAPMVIVPPDFDDVLLFDRVKQLLQPALLALLVHNGGGARRDDRLYLADGARGLNAYIKSPTALGADGRGFSAGSYDAGDSVAVESRDEGRSSFWKNKITLPVSWTYLWRIWREYRDAMQRDDLPSHATPAR